MMQNNVPTFMHRKPLFPGSACFPLSPTKKTNLPKKSGFPIDPNDQLKMIFNIIGTPVSDSDAQNDITKINHQDSSFVTDGRAIDYLTTFSSQSKIDLTKKFPSCSNEALDLFSKILTMNPYRRITVDECLNHPFLKSVRRIETEKAAPDMIDFQFEREGDLNEPRLRELLQDEINFFSRRRDSRKSETEVKFSRFKGFDKVRPT